MDPKDILLIAAGVATCVLVYLFGVLAAIRMRKPQFRRAGAWLALGIGAALAAQGLNIYFANQGRPDYVTSAPGAARGTGSATREIPYHVLDPDTRQSVELKMNPYPDASASGTLTVRYRIADPSGKQLLSGEQEVTPSGNQGWSVVRFDFEPELSGDHKLIVEIPADVDSMDVRIKESR